MPSDTGTSKAASTNSTTGPLAQMEPAAKVTHCGRQAWVDDVGADLGGDRGVVDQAAVRAGAGLSLVFGDDRRQFGEFGDLVPGGFAIVGPWFGGQGRVTAGTTCRPMRDDLMDPL
ncbi:MAG: hypothetical protein ABI353_20865 [Isosphaeraceae bacterium]